MFAYVARPICLFRYSFADMKVSAARQFSRRIRKDSLSRRSLRASSVEIGPAGVFLIALYKLSASSLEVALSRVLCKAQYIDAYHSSGQSGCAGVGGKAPFGTTADSLPSDSLSCSCCFSQRGDSYSQTLH